MNRSFFLKRYRELAGEDADKITTLPQSIRINTLRISEKELVPRLKSNGILLEKVPFLRHGFVVKKARFSPGASPEYLLGYYYLQELASQIPVEHMELKPSHTVLDMAAAPGSKTTQLAQEMQDKGVLVALESNQSRIQSLKNNLERCFISNTIVFRKDARFAFDLGIEFDRILLDAPCSGNFANDKDWFSNKSQESVNERARTQKELLKAALKCLKPKGILMYSTCSLEPEENELNIGWLLNKYDDIKLENISTIGDPGLTSVFGRELDPEVSRCRRLWPHRTGTQGFFLAKVRKK
ncbi:RsmB/NOP family class I SAM-dependent RNA methyltransferase [Candidatus Woesearchaeota archaeon]|nr:RsmB/NOP family class I SAM-dependent RNA methyltransferase [Candidatus Woesearchaeota archaeon]